MLTFREKMQLMYSKDEYDRNYNTGYTNGKTEAQLACGSPHTQNIITVGKCTSSYSGFGDNWFNTAPSSKDKK